MKENRVIKYVRMFSFILSSLCLLAGLLLFFASRWMLNYWPNMTMEELMFQLSAPMTGASSDVYLACAKSVVLPAVLIFLPVLLLWLLSKKKSLLHAGLCLCMIGCSIWLGINAKNYVWNSLQVDEYIDNQEAESTLVDSEYVDPATVQLTFPEKKRNLIYIFLESMEYAHADLEHGGVFEENQIPELTELCETEINFSQNSGVGGFRPTSGATWTMGGIFAQTSGLPLKIAADNNDMAYQTSFFPELTCMGDILEEEGYHQVFLLGSDATFGGRANYFTEHGGAELLDYYWAIDQKLIDYDYYVWWGYEDQKLMEYAKEELTKLSQEDTPFAFTMLTVDTHCQCGYVCDLCENEFEDQYANVFACSSRQAAELVEWIRQQDFYENTTIVLAGDHNTMDVKFNSDMDKSYTRHTYNCFVNSAVNPIREKNRIFTTLDLFPSTLAALGVEIEGNRLGLGVNLFSEEETLAERYTFDGFNKELKKNSKIFDTMNQDIAQIWQNDEQGKKYYIAEEKRLAQNEWVNYDPKRGKNTVPERYFFNQEGYAVTGWNKIDGLWYFFRSNGTMVYHPEKNDDAKASRKISNRSHVHQTMPEQINGLSNQKQEEAEWMKTPLFAQLSLVEDKMNEKEEDFLLYQAEQLKKSKANDRSTKNTLLF